MDACLYACVHICVHVNVLVLGALMCAALSSCLGGWGISFLLIELHAHCVFDSLTLITVNCRL